MEEELKNQKENSSTPAASGDPEKSLISGYIQDRKGKDGTTIVFYDINNIYKTKIKEKVTDLNMVEKIETVKFRKGKDIFHTDDHLREFFKEATKQAEEIADIRFFDINNLTKTDKAYLKEQGIRYRIISQADIFVGYGNLMEKATALGLGDFPTNDRIQPLLVDRGVLTNAVLEADAQKNREADQKASQEALNQQIKDASLKTEVSPANNYDPYARFKYVVIHELGHTLGLKHPHDTWKKEHVQMTDLGVFDNTDNTVMSYNDMVSITTFQEYDVKALRQMYGEKKGGSKYEASYLGNEPHHVRIDGNKLTLDIDLEKTKLMDVNMREGYVKYTNKVETITGIDKITEFEIPSGVTFTASHNASKIIITSQNNKLTAEEASGPIQIYNLRNTHDIDLSATDKQYTFNIVDGYTKITGLKLDKDRINFYTGLTPDKNLHLDINISEKYGYYNVDAFDKDGKKYSEVMVDVKDKSKPLSFDDVRHTLGMQYNLLIRKLSIDGVEISNKVTSMNDPGAMKDLLKDIENLRSAFRPSEDKEQMQIPYRMPEKIPEKDSPQR